MARLTPPSGITTRLRVLLRDESGVALVEFAISLPLLLLVFAMMIESSRLMMSYQAAITGVRDATRYLSRAVPENICATGGSLSGYTGQLQTLVEQGLSGKSVFLPDVTIASVRPSYSCITGIYRGSPVAVAQVTADVKLHFPFAGVIDWMGGSLSDFTTSVTDQARVAGS